MFFQKHFGLITLLYKVRVITIVPYLFSFFGISFEILVC